MTKWMRSQDSNQEVLMNSDQLQTVAIILAESGGYDEEYQDECREANLEERLAALLQPLKVWSLR